MPAPTPTPPESHPSPDAASYDRAGLALTTKSRDAAARYRDAVERFHGAQAGVAELLDEAIALDPAFAVAHAARWMQAHADSDARAAAVARDAALGSCGDVTDWERGHVECVAAMIERQPGAADKVREHLAKHPRDLLVATHVVGDLFFNGRDGKRQAVMDLLQGLAPHHGDDWAFAARLGFHMSELGDPRGAKEILARALEARPQAPFVAHAMAHAMLESGERAASYRFLSEWTSRHDPSGPIDGHIHWHLSLGELERGEPAAALARYERSTAPGASHCALGLLLADAGGLFCRMALDGMPLDGMPREALRELLGRLGGAIKVPFVAAHAAALALVLGEHDVLRSLEATSRKTGASGASAESLVVRAFKSFFDGDMRACLAALERDRPVLWEAIGGSNVERSLIAKLHESAASRLARS